MTSSARDPAEQVVDPGVGELAAEFSLVRRRSGYEKVEDGDRRAREGYMDLKEVPLPDDVQALTSARCHLCATRARRRPEKALEQGRQVAARRLLPLT